MTDNELISLWDNEDAKNVLYLRMLPSVIKITAPFRSRGISGYDYDDLLQEASLAFAKAVRSYDPNRNASFRTYLWIRVRSHMLNLVKHSKTDSARSLSNTVSLYDSADNDTPEIRLIDVLSTQESTYEDDAIREQSMELIRKRAKHILSKFEYSVFYLYLEGKKTAEISDALGCGKKSIENTLQRIRTKFRRSDKLHA